MNSPKTTLTALATAVMALLAFLASQPFSQGELALLIPVEWKPKVAGVCALAAVLLHLLNGHYQQDKITPPAAGNSQPPTEPKP